MKRGVPLKPDRYKEVLEAARAQGITEQPLAMEIPHPEDFEAIL